MLWREHDVRRKSDNALDTYRDAVRIRLGMDGEFTARLEEEEEDEIQEQEILSRHFVGRVTQLGLGYELQALSISPAITGSRKRAVRVSRIATIMTEVEPKM